MRYPGIIARVDSIPRNRGTYSYLREDKTTNLPNILEELLENGPHPIMDNFHVEAYK